MLVTSTVTLRCLGLRLSPRPFRQLQQPKARCWLARFDISGRSWTVPLIPLRRKKRDTICYRARLRGLIGGPLFVPHVDKAFQG